MPFLDFMQERAEILAAFAHGGAGAQAHMAGENQTRSRVSTMWRISSKPEHSQFIPAAAIAALRKVFPRDGVVSGRFRRAPRLCRSLLDTPIEPRTYISATNLGPMGWAIAAAIGVQCAKPSRRVAVITGDGCMLMHGLEVQTAARYGLPILYVVLNNNALGNVWLRAHQRRSAPR